MKFDAQFCKDHNTDSLGRPLGRLHSITRNDATQFTILPMDTVQYRYYKPLDKLVPTYYAVFEKVPHGFYQQVSRWYFYYGHAVRKLGILAKDVIKRAEYADAGE